MSDKKISQLPASTIPLAGTEEFALVQSGATKKVNINNVTVGRTVLFNYSDNTPVQIVRNAAGTLLKAITLDQPNTTDGNALGIEYRTNTTGSNVATDETFVAVRMKAVTHDWSTRRGDLEVYLAKGGTGLPKVLTVDPDNLTLNRGNLVIGTAGKGIDFSANSSAAGMTSELLDDYEEGTWTPSLGGDTTYTSQTGTYVKVGELVFLKGELVVDVQGTGSNNTISGLPFASTTGVDAIPLSFFSGLNQNVTFLTFRTGSTAMTAYGTQANTNVTAVRAIFTSAARVEFSGCYRTSA